MIMLMITVFRIIFQLMIYLNNEYFISLYNYEKIILYLCIIMKKLFLDDFRIPKDCIKGLVPSYMNKLFLETDWDIVRNYNEFVDWIKKNGIPDFISFDHDLADIHYRMDFSEDITNQGTEKTGYDCAKWLGEYCLDNNYKLPQYVVHSQNPVGKSNIKGYLDNISKFLND